MKIYLPILCIDDTIEDEPRPITPDDIRIRKCVFYRIDAIEPFPGMGMFDGVKMCMINSAGVEYECLLCAREVEDLITVARSRGQADGWKLWQSKPR